MKKSHKELFNLAIRYLILILVSFSGLWIFYFIFSPITIYLTAFLLKIFFQTSVIGDLVILKNHFLIQMINACVAGSAYYLLLILNLSVPKINIKKRIKMILFAFASFLIVNILRIIILTMIFFYGISWFALAHEIFWYVGSIALVVGIWFLEVKLFKIKHIPFYTDIKFLYKKSNLKC